jgi:hypothetical protein
MSHIALEALERAFKNVGAAGTATDISVIAMALDDLGFAIVPKADLAPLHLLHEAINRVGNINADTMAAGKEGFAPR